MSNDIGIYEVVIKLVGSIKPIGETNADDHRFANLAVMCDLVEKLLSNIDAVASNKDRVEYSMKRAGEYADKFATRMGIVE